MSSFGQKYFRIDQQKADSLEELLISVKGSERVDVLNELGYEYAWQKADRSKLLSNEALLLSTELGYRKGVGISYQVIGYREFLQGESAGAVDHLLKALNIFEELDDKYLVALTYHYLGTSYVFAGDGYKEEIYDYGTKALENYILIGDKTAMAGLYIAFAGVLANMAGDAEGGKVWIDKFLAIRNSVNLTHIEMGVGIATAGDIAFALGEPQKCIDYYNEALKIYDEKIVEEKALKAQQEAGLGMYYLKIGKVDTAFTLFDSAILISKSIGYLMGPRIAFYRKGAALEKQGEYEKAIACFDSCLFYSELTRKCSSNYEPEEFRDFVSWSFEIYRPASRAYKKNAGQAYLASANYKLSNIYNELGLFDKALACYKNYITYMDSTSWFSQNIEMEAMQAKYETEQKDEQITLLLQQNELNEIQVKQNRYLLYGLIGFAVLSIVVAIMLIRQYRLKLEQRNILLERKLLRSQMNPHFIYNALSNISNLIDKNENSKALKYLTKFSNLTRHIFESTQGDFIGLDKEMNNLENYLSLQKLRFEDKFDFTIEIKDKLKTNGYKIPPMFIQPFVENAIEHGIKPKDEKGHLDIRINLDGKLLVCEVDDDGVGRKKARELIPGEHKSMAVTIVRERLQTLRRKLNENVFLEIIDLQTETGISLGTRVKIGLPYIN